MKDVDREGYSAVQCAIRSNRNTEMIDLLARHGSDLAELTPQGETILELALNYHQDKEVVRCLVGHGADVNQKDAFGRTALHTAADRNDVPQVKLLLELGADPTVRSRWGLLARDLASGEARLLLEEALNE